MPNGGEFIACELPRETETSDPATHASFLLFWPTRSPPLKTTVAAALLSSPGGSAGCHIGLVKPTVCCQSVPLHRQSAILCHHTGRPPSCVTTLAVRHPVTAPAVRHPVSPHRPPSCVTTPAVRHPVSPHHRPPRLPTRHQIPIWHGHLSAVDEPIARAATGNTSGRCQKGRGVR